MAVPYCLRHPVNGVNSIAPTAASGQTFPLQVEAGKVWKLRSSAGCLRRGVWVKIPIAVVARREARGPPCRAPGEAGNEVSGATGRRLP